MIPLSHREKKSMDHLELLRSLTSAAGAPAAGTPLAPEELRFCIEYAAAADAAAARTRLRQILRHDWFVVEPLAFQGDLTRFLLVRFPQLERTLPRRDLFGMAYALAEALGAVGAEPDLGTDFFADPGPPSHDPAIESALVKGICWAPGEPPQDRRWALKNILALEAWSLSQGAGIVIGQPDTGIADHNEITPDMLDLERAGNMLESSPSPLDPLRPGAANPGHGTSTASVLASRSSGQITGAAPAAKIAPIRCIEDVKVFNAAPVARAISHATAKGVHVISMSLGGVASSALHAAVREAVANDIIVVAASGNCVGVVVWPARYKEVIAVAGTNAADQAWRGTSKGRAIDIAAPAEFVWRAARGDAQAPLDGVSGGQGTSFAAALVAGVAALWLSHHGRDKVIQAARQRGVKAQQLFKAAVAATARKPAQWDEDLGPGIIHAHALLQLKLDAIELPPAGLLESAIDSVQDLLDEQMGPGTGDPAFDWKRFHAEVATIALAEARDNGTVRNLVPEAKKSTTRPSPALSRSAASSKDERLQRFAEQLGAGVSRPRIARLTPAQIEKLAKIVPKSIGLESTGAAKPPDAVIDYLAGVGKQKEAARIESVAHRLASTDVRFDKGRRDEIVGTVRSAIGEIGQRKAVLSADAQVGLEALVMLTGRPALRVRGGVVDFNDPRGADWHDDIIFLSSQPDFKKHLQAVGRIDADGAHIGTGFVVAPGLVLTNRHVLQGFAAPVPRKNRPTSWQITEPVVTIDFADEPSSATQATKFRILGVAEAGADDIDPNEINFRKLDMALLHVEQTNADGKALPQPLCLAGDAMSVDTRREIFCVGYPARPSDLPARSTGEIDMDVVKRLAELFGTDFGTKYFAPGQVAKTPGWAGDPQSWVLTHDATTLGGNSGSCVVGTQGQLRVVGLHFGGAWLRENYAHALPSVRGKPPGFDRASLVWC
jgi:serine protease